MARAQTAQIDTVMKASGDIPYSQIRLRFSEFLDLFMDQIIQSDAALQVQQRRAWLDFTGGLPLVEGLDRLENLGLHEVELSFYLEPIGMSWLSRIWCYIRALFGKPQPQKYRLTGPENEGRPVVAVMVRIGRKSDGRWTVSSEPDKDASCWRDAHVPGILA